MRVWAVISGAVYTARNLFLVTEIPMMWSEESKNLCENVQSVAYAGRYRSHDEPISPITARRSS